MHAQRPNAGTEMGTLLEEHGAAIGRACMAWLGAGSRVADGGAVEAAVEEIFVQALEPGAAGPDGTTAGWLFGIAQRVCAQRLEVEERRTLDFADTQRTNAADTQRTRHALAELPPTERDAIVLCVVAGLALTDVARATRVAEGVARERIEKGLSKLRALLAGGALIMSCTRIDEDPLGVLYGTGRADLIAHLATCDACRDARHALGQLCRTVALAGSGYVASASLAERVEARVRAGTSSERASHARIRTAPVLEGVGAPHASPRRRRLKPFFLGMAAIIGISTGVAVGVKAADWHKSPRSAASRAWHGSVGKISRSGVDKIGGLTATLANGTSAPLAEGGK